MCVSDKLNRESVRMIERGLFSLCLDSPVMRISDEKYVHTHIKQLSVYRCYINLHSVWGKKNPYNLITMLSCFCHIEFCSVCTLTHTHTTMAFPSQQKIRVHEYMLPCTDTNSLSLVFVEHVHLIRLLILICSLRQHFTTA